MSTPTNDKQPPARNVPDLPGAGAIDDTVSPLDEATEQRLDEIEMMGEEDVTGLRAPGQSEISANMRFLHSSRTIHQLVTDRNRAVGLYLAVASLMWTASTALLNVKQEVRLMVPIDLIQYWCLPVTFSTLTVLALFTGFLLIRTRIGLIYEVAKMNTLLGLPIGRVQRVQPLSIFFIMHLLVSLAGGASALFLTYQILYRSTQDAQQATLVSGLVGLGVSLLLLVLYIVTVLVTTSDSRLTASQKK